MDVGFFRELLGLQKGLRVEDFQTRQEGLDIDALRAAMLDAELDSDSEYVQQVFDAMTSDGVWIKPEEFEKLEEFLYGASGELSTGRQMPESQSTLKPESNTTSAPRVLKFQTQPNRMNIDDLRAAMVDAGLDTSDDAYVEQVFDAMATDGVITAGSFADLEQYLYGDDNTEAEQASASEQTEEMAPETMQDPQPQGETVDALRISQFQTQPDGLRIDGLHAAMIDAGMDTSDTAYVQQVFDAMATNGVIVPSSFAELEEYLYEVDDTDTEQMTISEETADEPVDVEPNVTPRNSNDETVSVDAYENESEWDTLATAAPTPVQFDVRSPSIQRRWDNVIRAETVVRAPQGCSDGAPELMLNQQSSMRFVGAVVAQWASENTRWSDANAEAPTFAKCANCNAANKSSLCKMCTAQGQWRREWSTRPVAPPPLRGLIVAHNVGGGKTATALGMALHARRSWPDCTVIIAAEDDVAKNLAGSLPKEYYHFSDFGIHNLPVKDLVKGPHTVAVGPVQMAITCYTFPQGAAPEFDPLPNGSPSVMLWSLDTTMKDSLVEPHFQGPMYKTDSYGRLVLGENNVPIVHKQIRSGSEGTRRLKPHWTSAECTTSAGKTCVDNVRRIPDGPVVLIVDEAHNLSLSDGTATKLENFGIMREFLADRSSSNIYRVLLTATPGSTVHEVVTLANLVAPPTPANERLFNRIKHDKIRDQDKSLFARALDGCVDVWQTLGNTAVYPTLRFEDDRVPFVDEVQAVKHVNATCVQSASYSVTSAVDALREDPGFKAYAEYYVSRQNAAHGVADVPLSAVLGQAVLDSRGVNDEDAEEEKTDTWSDGVELPAQEIAFRDAELDKEAQSNLDTSNKHTLAAAALASARTFAQFVPSAITGNYGSRPERIKRLLFGKREQGTVVKPGLLQQSAEALRTAAARGDRSLPDCPLTSACPRLASLAIKIMEALPQPLLQPEAEIMQGNSQRYVPPCKQLVVVPLSRTQKHGFPQHLFVRRLLEIVCNLSPLKWRGGPLGQEDAIEPGKVYYLDTANADVNQQLKGCGGCVPSASVNRDSCSTFNYPENAMGQIIPVVLIHDAARTTAYNMEGLQRIHLTDWCDPTVAAQAMGRGQRPYASVRLPPQRRKATVYTYSTCGAAVRNHSSELVQSMEKHAGPNLAHALASAQQSLLHDAEDKKAIATELLRAERLVQQIQNDSPTGGITMGEYELIALLGTVLRPTDIDRKWSAGALPGDMCKFVPAGTSSLGDLMSLWGVLREHMVNVVPIVRGKTRELSTAIRREHTRYEAQRDMIQQTAAAHSTLAGLRNQVEARAETIDQALARAHAFPYTPVLELYGALMEASVSCSLYSTIHRQFGQLPGIPLACGIPQSTGCDDGSGAAPVICETEQPKENIEFEEAVTQLRDIVNLRPSNDIQLPEDDKERADVVTKMRAHEAAYAHKISSAVARTIRALSAPCKDEACGELDSVAANLVQNQADDGG